MVKDVQGVIKIIKRDIAEYQCLVEVKKSDVVPVDVEHVIYEYETAIEALKDVLKEIGE